MNSIAFRPQKKHNLPYIIRICAVASLGGLLFGYDTSVISGAIDALKVYFQLSPAETGWAVSNVVIGCVIGSLCSGEMARKIGRKKTLIIAALLFTVSAIGSAVVESFFWFIVYRMIGGVAVGLAAAISPMYIAEVAPKDYRGTASAMNNFALVFGQIVIFYVNYKIAQGMTEAWLVDVGWRYMIGSEVIPCLLFCLVVGFIPESPRWDAMRGRDDLALATLSKISNPEHAKNLLAEIKASMVNEAGQVSKQKVDFKRPGAIFIIIVACALATFQQLSGVNVMMYYAPTVLKTITGSIEEAMFQTIWIGVAQLVGIGIGAILFDKLGRLPLMKTGAIGAALGLLLTSYAMYTQNTGYLALVGMIFFMIFYAFSWGVGMWVLIGEIFPNYLRAQGLAIAVSFNWIFNFVVSQSFPMMNENPYLLEQFHGAFPMWIFAGCCVIGFIFLIRYVPETKGVSLEKMEPLMLSKLEQRRKQPVYS
ncbi:sugar porter family MFS transporter [Actinobacillus porcinus]|uniref:sugar porter family MFS transporter n=1 Tax=Actinobacillus porcinus TaxID=51048 RepID=UPI002351FFA0|nr:sugar porter family MFS transporter [Actinobacillus porcinus]MDD7544770.1 sugar porter family MFS transporter [Actinobacillus porcinus]MDY5848145.1 sugar porter family MFS transporter [Actinobacillus porcinus]